MFHLNSNNDIRAYNGSVYSKLYFFFLKIKVRIFKLNSYLKHYNAPQIENSTLENVAIDNFNGRSKISFSRKILINSVNSESSQFDLSQCNYIAIGNGNLVDDSVQTHLDYPVFTNQCYNLTEHINPIITTTIDPNPFDINLYDFHPITDTEQTVHIEPTISSEINSTTVFLESFNTSSPIYNTTTIALDSQINSTQK